MSFKFFTNAIRTYYVGDASKFVLKPQQEPVFPIPGMSNTHLYIHIPFCKHGCPYCPYNKVEFQQHLAERYFEALHREIDLYHQAIGNIEISSVYFGGGSPSIIPDKITEVLEHLRRNFNLKGDICIELNPNDCDRNSLEILYSAGINVVSVGVQSFQEKHLKTIGRNYNVEVAVNALKNTLRIFSQVNIDLMFALPGQSSQDLTNDIEKAVNLGANQITVYPLFTFPYTTIGRFKKMLHVKMPGLRKRRQQYFMIYDMLKANSFNQVSVWSFKKGSGTKYSSVTRDGYLGFGAGAGTHFENGYYLNTFSVEAYIDRINGGKYPTALRFEFDDKMNNLFWLYWRFYDSRIPIQEFKNRFLGNSKIQQLIFIFIHTGLLIKGENEFLLTRKGSFWLHLAQNHFSLDYINTIWGKALKEPFPDDLYF
jgi:oxygen-independent coproporphyrinogen III oxidase